VQSKRKVGGYLPFDFAPLSAEVYEDLWVFLLD
jgi:hypothetical protein